MLLQMISSKNGNQTQQNLDSHKHCILVAASNPYPLPTPVYRPRQNVEQSENTEIQSDGRLSDAETVAKSFAQVVTELKLPFSWSFFIVLQSVLSNYRSYHRSCSAISPCQLFVQSSFPS